MRRQEFIDNCADWWDLKDACSDEGSYICDDIYSSDEFDDYIDNEMYDRARNDSWTGVRDWLNDIPEGYDWYEVCDGDYYAIDGDGETFERYKEDFIAWMDDHGNWDEEEEEEEEEDFEEEEEDEEELEDIDLDEFFDDDYEETRASYVKPEPPIYESVTSERAPEPEPEPEVFKDISELFEITV